MSFKNEEFVEAMKASKKKEESEERIRNHVKYKMPNDELLSYNDKTWENIDDIAKEVGVSRMELIHDAINRHIIGY